MPRKKSVPVRREADRFHPDSLESRNAVREEVEEESELEERSTDLEEVSSPCLEIADEGGEWISETSGKHSYRLRLDSNAITEYTGWTQISKKHLSQMECRNEACRMQPECLQLHTTVSNTLAVVCGVCEACLMVSGDATVNVSQGRALAVAVQSGSIHLHLCTDQRDGNDMLALTVRLNPAATALSSVVLNWVLSGSTMCQTVDNGWYYSDLLTTCPSIEQKFRATQFLEQVSLPPDASRSNSGNGNAMAIKELQQRLQSLGVRTKLRDYQLQGVLWMHDNLIYASTSSSSVSKTGNDPAQEVEDWQYHAVGWVRLPSPAASNVHRTSCNSSTNNHCTPLWYNIHTEEVSHSTFPPSHMQLPTSLILADEMGVGKSLQIISLVLLVQGSTSSASTAGVHSNVQAPKREPGSFIATAGTETDAVGSGVSTAMKVDTESVEGTYVYSTDPDPGALSDDIIVMTNTGDTASESMEESCRACLCGEAGDLANKAHRLLGWIQCASCATWLHAPCAGFSDTQTMQQCTEYTCLACSCLQSFAQPIQSRTTLIVMPNTLINQWKSELLKHVEKVTFNTPDAESGLKVFIYPEEVGKKKCENYARLDPRTLTGYDIVLLSFRALQKGYHECNVDYGSERILRSSYAVYPPPFLCLHYALVVVDETQNIESTTSQVLAMACRIPSTHRISVSGTPFGSGKLADLYTLCQFLRVEPYASNRGAWLRVIERPTVCVTAEARLQWLRALFQRILLRRTKQMIQAELGLPEHTVITKPLQFSTFERALYEEKLGQYCNALLASSFSSHNTVNNDARSNSVASSSSSAENAAATNSSSSVLHIDMFDAKSKLELLRKGCCHPQVLDKSLASKQRSNAAASTVVVAGPRPLDEIMVAKVEQTRLSCEEYQRVLLFNLFAMAGATALQAQCATLHLTGFDSAVQPAPAPWYLSQAQRIYHAALSLIDRHRQSTVLIALIKLSGDEQLVYNDCKVSAVAGGMLVPHSQEGLQLRWQLGPLQSAGQLSLAVPTASWHALVHPKAVFNSLDTTAVDLITQVPLADCLPSADGGVCARQMFANSRRVSGCSAKFNVTDHIRRFCSANTEAAGTDGRMRYQALCFPAQVVLQAGVGAADTFVHVHTMQVPFPTANTTGAAETSGDIGINPHSGTATAAAPRSKKWQVCVKSIHSVCLVLRAERTATRSVTFSHAWTTLSALESMQIKLLNVSTAACAGKECVWEVTAALDVCLHESAFDTDALQELHVCHNMRSLPTLMSDDQQLSQYHLHTRQHASSAAVIDFKQLKPGAIVCPGLTETGHESDRPATGADILADRDAVIAQRAAVIEMEFLEAANSRRLVADYNLSDLSTQVSDLDVDIGVEINKVHHCSTHGSTAVAAGSVSCEGGGGVEGANGSHNGTKKAAPIAATDRAWWNELLTSLHDDVHFQASLQSCIDQGESAYRKLANFSTICGLQYLLGREFDDMEHARKASLKVLASLSKTPTAAEILESTDCRQCRQYFGKTGPVCGHCKKQAFIQEYSSHILCFRRQNKRMVATTTAAAGASPKKKAKSSSKNGVANIASHTSGAHILGDRAVDYEDQEERADFEVRSFDEGAVDGLLLMVLKQLRPHAAHFTFTKDDDISPSSVDPSYFLAGCSGRTAHKYTFKELCALEIKRQECLKSELSAMMTAWDRYSDVLKAHDELAQSKTRMSLSLPAIVAPSVVVNDTASAGARVSAASCVAVGPSSSKKIKAKSSADKDGGEESSLLLRPYELPGSLSRSYAAVLQADNDLKRSLGSLQFYKEQVREIFTEMRESESEEAPFGETRSNNAGEDASNTGMHQQDADPGCAENGAVSCVFSTPSKARVQTCLFCREELQLGSTLHSPTRHRPPLPSMLSSTTAAPDGTTAKEAALTVSEEVVVLPCAHRYHKDCVTKWVQKHKACPLCKAKATVADFIAVAQYAVGPSAALLSDTPSTPAKVFPIPSSLDAAQSQTPMKHSRPVRVNTDHHTAGISRIATTSGAAMADTVAADTNVDADGKISRTPSITSSAQPLTVRQPPHPQRSRLKGKWGTKVDTLVMDLLELTQDAERQDEKAIVFSQWIEMVDIVCEALRCNGISHVKCANRSKDFIATGGVESFRNNTTIRVIVMPLALGAEGLDLIVASHVFLLEPLLNVHQEMQAVNRISRLGQQKRTFVHKFVIGNTIEERIVLVQNRTAEGVHGVYSPSKGHRQRSDDDLLSESDLCFILGLQAHTVSRGQRDGALENVVTNLPDAVEQPAASSYTDGVQEMIDTVPVDLTTDADHTDDTSTDNGVMDLTSNLLEHFE